MVGPAAKRAAVAHLEAEMGLSERRACSIVGADRKMIRYRSHRPQRIRNLNDAIAQLAKRYTLPTVFFSRADVRQQFAYLGTVTKDAIAMAMAKHIPAFERFLPRMRKPWESEDA